MDCFILFCAVRKMALVCRNARNLSTSGDISDRYWTSDFTLKLIERFQDAKLWKEALGSKFEWLLWTWSPYFSTAVKKWHVDLRECMCNVLLWVDFLGYVVSDFTKYTIKRIRELIMARATHLSKIQQVWVAGMDCFIIFCAVSKMALVCRNARNLSTSGDISDR